MNSGFFHSWINRTSKLQSLEGIFVNNRWVDSAKEVKAAATQYFGSQFKARNILRPQLPADLFVKQISGYQNEMLCVNFTKEEVKSAIWSCDSSKSPGPDAFSFAFIKSNWSNMMEEIMQMMYEFHEKGRIVRGLNSSFIVLIPKKGRCTTFEDYRPISLLGCIYKIIAKTLDIRLSKVLDEVTSKNQTAFLGGRYILDGIVILNELIDEAKKRKLKRIIFKVDFAKAYDTIEWNFLDEMMCGLNFSPKWRKWILECISSVSAAVLINGSPSENFNLE